MNSILYADRFTVPLSASAQHADGAFTVQVDRIELKGDEIGINAAIEKGALQGDFRLMDGKVYRVLNQEPPPVSELLKLAEEQNDGVAGA